MKEILDKTTNMIDIYYKISEDYINNFNKNKRNYHKLKNLYSNWKRNPSTKSGYNKIKKYNMSGM